MGKLMNKKNVYAHTTPIGESMKQEHGVTLIELMVTLTIAVVLLTIAVPSFVTFMKSNNLSSQANDLIASINYARSEAIKRGVSVTMCPSSNGTSCLGTWSNGWLIFVDNDSSGTVNGADAPLRIHEALPNTYTAAATLANSGGAAKSFLQFARNGTAVNIGKFAVCKDSDETTAQVISIELIRPRIAPDVAIINCEAP